MIYLLIFGVVAVLLMLFVGGYLTGRSKADRLIALERLYRAMQEVEAPPDPLPRARPFPVDTAPMRALPPLSDGSAAWEALERQQRGWGW